MNNKFVKLGFLCLTMGAFIFAGVEEELKKINQKLDGISTRLTQLEKKVAAPAAAPNKAKADPNKVYNIADAESVVLGDADAKITVIKWTDFQ